MCEACQRAQDQISKYRRFLDRGFDPLTEERMKAAIAELERDLQVMSCRIPQF